MLRPKYLILAALTLGAIGLTAILYPSHAILFRPYSGNVIPPLAMTLIAAIGAVSLRLLDSRGWFVIHRRGMILRGMADAAKFATLFAIVVILVDCFVPFSQKLNVPAPQSLFFYPAIAFAAEITFHALPLALMLGLLSTLLKKPISNGMIWACSALASLIEPAFQVAVGQQGNQPSWTDAFVGLHVFAFNLVQLYVFRRHDFVSMISMRLVYYLYWHIAWGHFRLQWLF